MRNLKQTRRESISILCFLSCIFLILCGCQPVDRSSLTYHFTEPARFWEESFPLGNGRLGMMPDGGTDKERIVLNEISMWSGSKQNTDNPAAYKSLGQIRKLLFEGLNDEAQQLMYDTFVCGGQGSAYGNGANAPYGSYQILGNLLFEYTYPGNADSISSYRRELNLNDAITTVSFRKGNTGYTRESFTSFADDIVIIRLTSDVAGSIHFSVGMNRPEHYSVSIEGNDLLMKGRLPDGVDTLEMKGISYDARVRVILPKDGQLLSKDSTLTVQKASEVLILVGMGTDYFDKEKYLSQTGTFLTEAAKKSYQELKEEHLKIYREMFGRVELDLGYSDKEKLPMGERLRAFQKDKDDPSLAALYFQFGRYLLISSTRPGLLPPNLQGLWCNTIRTPWNGDYHLNINLQMNLWPAEVANLSELHMSMIEWTKQQVRSGQRTAKVFYNARGWVTHILGNVWEFTAPGEHPSWGATNTSAAWLCEHLYTHYQFTKDKEYLKDVYPAMKEAALFFVDMLVEDPRNGYLVTAPTTSPENAFRMPNGKTVHICAGSTMDNQIIRELFTNTREAALILGIDEDFAKLLETKQSRLMPTTIGADGRIMEWLEPYEEAEPTHRHVSHLYGLYPGNEISVELTPELANAAKKTLEKRGDKSTGWSMAWKINFWARLHDGDHAFKLLGDLLRPGVEEGGDMMNDGGSYPNLFCGHPPFQIDGNFGGCAGIAEMLVQSQTGRIELLPALPQAWSKGSFKGLKVRGGGELSASWSEGRLNEAMLKALVSGDFNIKLPENTENVTVRKNGKAISLPVVDGLLTVDLQEGEELALRF